VAIHALIATALPPKFQWPLLIAAFLLTCAASLALAPWAMRYWKTKDPKHFVLDEVAGYLVVPILFVQGSFWKIAFWGFVLFRFFDIVKPPPANRIDKSLDGPWGILLDDIAAGLYAVVVMYAILRIWPALLI